MGSAIDGVVVKVSDGEALIRTARNGDHTVKNTKGLKVGQNVKITINEIKNCVGQVLTDNDLTTKVTPCMFPPELEELEEDLSGFFSPDF